MENVITETGLNEVTYLKHLMIEVAIGLGIKPTIYAKDLLNALLDRNLVSVEEYNKLACGIKN